MRRGFTLVELLVVTAAFAVVFLVATTVYTRAFRDQRTTQSRQRNTSDNRYLIETLARAIRTGTIDYTFYEELEQNGVETADASHHQLALLNANGTPVCFGFNGATQKIRSTTSCNSSVRDIPSSATDITPADVVIEQLSIFIRPGSDPFANTGLSPVTCDRAQTNQTAAPVFPNPGCLANQWCCPSDVATCHPENDGSNLSVATPGVCAVANIQPTVTFLITSRVNDRGQTTTSTVQTTVTSRAYRR